MWSSVISITALVSAVVVLLIIKHRRSLRKHQCKSSAILHRKTAIITGANCGIGFETALNLAKRRARVILACRSAINGEKAVLSIRKRTNNQNVEFYELDLSSLASVRAFSQRILDQEPHVDILINNAGVMYPGYSATEDGLELHMAVNHLGHFLLTNLLLERLKESQESRIINVSSVLYKNCEKFDFENVNCSKEECMNSKQYSKNAYAQSKLANILFTRELARRLKNTGVTANVVSPGLVQTNLGRHFFLRLPFVLRPPVYVLLSLLLKTPWEGAQTTIHCAVAEELKGVSGEFFRDCQQTPLLTAVSRDEHVARKLWDMSTRLVGVH